MASSSDATTMDLVLDFLASKGFTDAEDALRLAAESQPKQEPSESISALEQMLIRGRVAAETAMVVESKPVLQPLAMPDGIAVDSSDMHGPASDMLSDKLKGMQVSKGAKSGGAAAVVWHEPEKAGAEEDEWTDDEALGYL